MIGLEVLSAGPMTTVQDLGRWGYQGFGVPVSGALDPLSLRLANALVGNAPDVAGLELRLMGPHLRLRGGPARLALCGSATPIEIIAPAPSLIPPGQSVLLPEGAELRIGPLRDSACACLAVAGGFDLPPVFGSLSTYVTAGLGGLEGRALRAGDLLPLAGSAPQGPDLMLPRAFDAGTGPIRVVLGPQDGHFTPDAVAQFLSAPYQVSASANRMGMRLEGPVLRHAGDYNIASDGVVSGAIQVPGDGQPIILLADRQTTGGYAKIATVISADLPRLGRALPGQALQFTAISPDQAEALRRRQESALQAAIAAIAPLAPSPGEIQARLLRENLISGAITGSERD